MDEPLFRRDSYRPCDLCNPIVHCAYGQLSTADEPCWGDVMIEDPRWDGETIHTCQGHWAFPWGDDYERPTLRSEEIDV